MLSRYGPRCAITGTQQPETLEAARIRSYSRSPRHDRDNGLLRRRDLHALFDRGLITIDPQTWTVEVAPTLMTYRGIAELHGSPVDLPTELRPQSALVRIAATASRAALRAVARDRLRRPWTRRPLTWEFAPARRTGKISCRGG
jgi:HNH endonuclease